MFKKEKKLIVIVWFFVFSLTVFSLIVPRTSADNDCDTVFCGQDMKNVLEDEVKDNLDGVAKTDNLILLILGWVSFFLPYAALLAFVGIIYAGFLYVTGFANEENVGKAKSILMWSIIGLIVIFMAYAIVSTFVNPTG